MLEEKKNYARGNYTNLNPIVLNRYQFSPNVHTINNLSRSPLATRYLPINFPVLFFQSLIRLNLFNRTCGFLWFA